MTTVSVGALESHNPEGPGDDHDAPLEKIAGRSPMQLAMARFRKDRLSMNYGMALAASVVLAATTAAVMFVVERLRVPSVGTF